MPIPDYQTLMLPVLRLIAQGHQTIPQCIPHLAEEFGLSEEEVQTMLPSGKQTLIANRAHWARNYMSQAALVQAIRRGHYELTEEGRSLLASNPQRIDNRTLKQFAPFREWMERSRSTDTSKPDPVSGVPDDDGATPEDSMAAASNALDAALVDDLLVLLREMNPVRFERLILDLLGAMGYGGGDLSNTMMTKASGDGGIDGIIHEDALGLDAVYIQAKRYAPDNKISRPAIQQFVGSLTGEGATKGVFVTTSDFSAEARAYLNKVQHRIVLINGRELARRMIRHDVGVRARKTYVIKSVDEDYFADATDIFS